RLPLREDHRQLGNDSAQALEVDLVLIVAECHATSMPAGGRADEALLGAGLRCGEFLLPLPEGLFGATTPPIAGDRRPFRIDATFFADVWPQIVHHSLRLAVDKGVHLTGHPECGLDGLDQRRMVARAVLPDQI